MKSPQIIYTMLTAYLALVFSLVALAWFFWALGAAGGDFEDDFFLGFAFALNLATTAWTAIGTSALIRAVTEAVTKAMIEAAITDSQND